MLVEMGKIDYNKLNKVTDRNLIIGRKYLCRQYWFLDVGSGKITFNGLSNKFDSCTYIGMRYGKCTKVWNPIYLFSLEGVRIEVSAYQLHNHFKLDIDESVEIQDLAQLYGI
jgi:hypothetical protein